MGVSYGTESKRTESGAGRGGKFFFLWRSIFSSIAFIVSGLRWHGPRHTCFCLTGRWAQIFFCMISMSFTKKGEENEVM